MIDKPTTPQGIGQVLDRTFRLAATSFRHTWLLALLSGLGAYAATIYQLMSGDAALAGSAASMFAMSGDPLYWVLYVGGTLISIWLAAAMYYRIDAVASGNLEQVNAVSMALRRLPLLVLLVILWGICIGIGMVLLIIPGIILAITLVPSQAIFLLEERSPIAALNTSHRLVWGHWWRTFATLLVGGIIALVVYFLLSFVAGFIAAILGSAEAALVAALTMFLAIALAGVFLAPYLVSLILNIYWDLKLRKEGGDLAARLQTA
jgi:hypothetical protein